MGALKNSTAQRRVSPRLQNLPDDQRPYYGPSPKRTSESAQNDAVAKKKPKVEKPSAPAQKSASNAKSSKEKEKVEAQNGESETKTGPDVEDGGADFFAPDGRLTDENGVSFTARLKETLRLFNLHYLHFIQEEEKRCSKLENGTACCDDLKEPSRRPGNDSACDDKRQSKRPDLKAISKMLSNNEILYPERKIGHVPGIEVGHQFFSRAEMVAVGFHAHWLNGIDYIGESRGKEKYKRYTLPLAVSIVMSGQYEDDVDNKEEVIYTGQGGHDLLGDKKQIKHQVLLRGNLALKNNMEQSIPVRVIRGHKCVNSYSKKVYTYDGLYKVVDYWADKGAAGFDVFKYCLKRDGGQPKLLSKQVHFIRGRGSKVQPEIPGLVCKDICNGQENICIPATNVIDVPPMAPEGLTYTKSIKVAKDVNIPSSAPGCSCKGNCTNPLTCSCAKLNGSDFPYVARDGGRLIEPKAVVFECGPNCGCGPACVNRTSQRGLNYRLEVYRTADKGWAVRSWDFIPSGAPVCEYTGVLRKNDDLDSVSENDYIFEIDCWHTMNGIGGREKRLCDVSIPNGDAEKGFSKLSESEPEFCIDAGSYGNIARYINHSCEPNLFVQCVLSSHHDVRLARVVLFAADNIPPLQELTYDYGYELDSVVGPDGNIKKLLCYCGVDGCRKRLY
ncbi:histone-lysine N-methyltransferase, H3 lysine-9 specific SUVH4-like [Prunus avium]|uniref:Histone-lysine N-methyltransferase, H3 lysine-9 specific SUVH4-like n=1 Tax=Prunus avium TaxID=42229 RepID=A0A6P5T935_PRUAV|nr:histone-lysine N-methyltransferase, H3 lysine-9 specific SUVH4-like [Prunus avium]